MSLVAATCTAIANFAIASKVPARRGRVELGFVAVTNATFVLVTDVREVAFNCLRVAAVQCRTRSW